MTSVGVQALYSRQSAKYSGSFTSRVIDAIQTGMSWTTLSWKTTLPFFKALPDYANSAVQNENSTDYASLVGSTGSTSDNNLMSGIVGLWHFSEPTGTTGAGSVKDDSGLMNNGTPTSGSIFGAQGRLGNGVLFDNLNSISLPRTYTTSPFSLQFWVKASPQSDRKIFAEADPEGGNALFKSSYMLSTEYNGTMRLWVRSAANTLDIAASTTSIVFDGQWHHVALSDNNGATKIYVDGLQDVTNFNYTPSPRTSITSTIGKEVGVGGGEFTGALDEFAIWNRILNPKEVMQLYRRGANRVKHQV